MVTSSNAPAVFHRVDPDTLCLSCLQIGDQSRGCPSCGFDERAAPPSPLHLPPRTILHGQYLLGRVLGQGGFGITYLAWDLNLDTPVALKEFLPTEFASRASGQLGVRPYGEDGVTNFGAGLDAFEAEARTLARCYGLSGVVDVLNYFRENGTGYIVMHYLQGRTFREHLRAREAPLAYEETVTIMRPVLAALREVHRLGLVHRDVSPDNIYICDSGRVCLLDFGAARNAVRDHSKSLSVQFKAGYTPEEQYRRHGAQGPWTDLYAAAATIYRALTGVTPPPALDRLKQDQLRPPGSLGAALPRAAERALMRALAVRADQRPRGVMEFLEQFAPPDAVAGLPAPGSSPHVPQAPHASHGPHASRGSDVLGAFGLVMGWLATAAIDLARIVRAWLDAALKGAVVRDREQAARERAIREQLAALWPMTLVSASLRDPELPAGPAHGPLDVYGRERTRGVGFDVVLQNNYAGIRPLRGMLGAVYIDPGGVAQREAAGGSGFTLELPVLDLVDRASISGTWGPQDSRGFQPGVWRIELWWDARKIGERTFVIGA
jgi:serine/threonine protein kinase